MATLDTLSAAWASEPDFTDDRSNDYQSRSMTAEEAAERNAANVKALAGKAECGHCGRLLNIRSRAAAKHVIACESKYRPYRYGATK